MNIFYKSLFAVATVATLLSARALSQTDGTLVLTEAQQKTISQVQDRAADRRLKDQTESADGPVQNARKISSALDENLKAKDLEGAAEAWWSGRVAGVPKTLESLRNEKLAEAKDAAQDAVNLIQATVRHSARNNLSSDANTSLLTGDSGDQVGRDMGAVEQEKHELDQDLRNQVEQLGKSFPELRHILQQTGFTSAGVRELVISRLREANQYVYQAGIYETNLVVWKNMQRIIKSRYVNGGEPQLIATQNATDVIKASDSDKFFK